MEERKIHKNRDSKPLSLIGSWKSPFELRQLNSVCNAVSRSLFDNGQYPFQKARNFPNVEHFVDTFNPSLLKEKGEIQQKRH